MAFEVKEGKEREEVERGRMGGGRMARGARERKCGWWKEEWKVEAEEREEGGTNGEERMMRRET